MQVIDNAQLPDHEQWRLSFVEQVFSSQMRQLKETKIDTIEINGIDDEHVYCSAHGYDFIIQILDSTPCAWDNDGNVIAQNVFYRGFYGRNVVVSKKGNLLSFVTDRVKIPMSTTSGMKK